MAFCITADTIKPFVSGFSCNPRILSVLARRGIAGKDKGLKARRIAHTRLTKETTMYLALLHKIHESRASLVIINFKDLLLHIKNPSRNEQNALHEARQWQYYTAARHKHELQQFYNEYGNDDEMRSIFEYPLSGFKEVPRNGIYVLADTASKHYNVVNGTRVTTDQPEKYNKTIHIFGNCNAVGCFAEDRLTIASQLQKKLNDSFPNAVRVVNTANWQGFTETARQILSPKYQFQPNDVVVILSHTADWSLYDKALDQFQDTPHSAYYDLSDLFQRPHTHGEIIFDNIHMNHKGYGLVADRLHSILADIFDAQKSRLPDIPHDLLPYMNYITLLKKKRGSIQGTVGSIVMNCNPYYPWAQTSCFRSVKTL